MTLIILLFALGILFIAVEVIVPGAILGTVGALLMFAGCVMAFVRYDTQGGIIAVVSALAVAGVALVIEFRVLPKTKIGKRAFLTKEITGASAAFAPEARNLIGKSAEALTMLSPTGYILIEGQRYEAFSQAGQIPAGSALEVTGADNFRLIVAPSRNKADGA
jgi:membrane-bound ClpP family serine protease